MVCIVVVVEVVGLKIDWLQFLQKWLWTLVGAKDDFLMFLLK